MTQVPNSMKNPFVFQNFQDFHPGWGCRTRVDARERYVILQLTNLIPTVSSSGAVRDLIHFCAHHRLTLTGVSGSLAQVESSEANVTIRRYGE